MKNFIVWLSVAGLIGTSFPALALPATLETAGTTRTLNLPTAADHSPVISLGEALDPQTGEIVSGYAIVHYRQSQARPSGGGGGGNVCYGYLGSGAKWKVAEPWLINPANTDGLLGSFVFDNFTANIAKWEDAADGTIGNGLGTNILGNGTSVDVNLQADTVTPDGLNETYFGAINDGSAIAVTIVWGIFGGPPSGRSLSEWDMIFNQDYTWSAAGEANKMDFENIATHELGHAIGLADLYTSGCNQETMYGYADFGQTNKRDLHTGDIIGTNKLY